MKNFKCPRNLLDKMSNILLIYSLIPFFISKIILEGIDIKSKAEQTLVASLVSFACLGALWFKLKGKTTKIWVEICEKKNKENEKN